MIDRFVDIGGTVDLIPFGIRSQSCFLILPASDSGFESQKGLLLTMTIYVFFSRYWRMSILQSYYIICQVREIL
jgi:hypothetical protein